MVMTRPGDGVHTSEAARDAHDARPRRVVTRARGLPGGRAVTGGLLIALAGVGTFVSWRQASGAPRHSYAVATRDLRPGDPLTADDLRYRPLDLPADVAGGAFDTPADLEGRVLVAPVGEGELLQQGSLSDQGRPDPAAEVSLALPRDLAVDGRVRPGDTVDVYATHDDSTVVVAEEVRVIAVTEAGSSFADGSELTVTLGLIAPEVHVPVIHAARAGEVTLVRTTHAPRASSGVGAVPTEGSTEGSAREPTEGQATTGPPSTAVAGPTTITTARPGGPPGAAG